MKIRWIAAFICTLVATHCSAASWLTDYDTAVEQAKREGKAVLMNFTGSDWCPWCVRLKAEVFDTSHFGGFADANLVLLEVDFPRRKPLSAEQQAKNKALQAKFGVRGFPTVILLNSAGTYAGQLGYMQGGPVPFIDKMRMTPNIAWREGGTAPATSQHWGEHVKAPSAQTAPAPAAPADPWAGMNTSVKRYDDLKLTGISGTAARRFAMVNNQTFAPGETARVKLKGKEVKVVCKEIRDRSVIVLVEGETEPRELRLEAGL